MLKSLKLKAAWSLYDLRQGIVEGFPPCCIARYTLERLIHPTGRPYLARPGVWRGERYVACGLIHRTGRSTYRNTYPQPQDRR